MKTRYRTLKDSEMALEHGLYLLKLLHEWSGKELEWGFSRWLLRFVLEIIERDLMTAGVRGKKKIWESVARDEWNMGK
jgi:hypothetical protein